MVYRAALLLLLLVGVCAYRPIVHAQIETETQLETLGFKLSPEYPRPYESVSLTVESGALDLRNAVITYYLNGGTPVTITGRAPFTFSTGAPGEEVRIRVAAMVDGTTYEDELLMYPQDVVLVLEPQSTIYPGYRGAALLPAQTETRVIALPDFRTPAGVPVSPSSLSYAWSVGVRSLSDQSGLGKNVLRIEGPQRYRDAVIAVTITSREAPYIAYAEVPLVPVQPILRVYKNDPLLGPWFSAALSNTYTMSGEEESFVVIPYFFDAPPLLAWSVSGGNQSTTDTLTLRSSGAGAGTASVSVKATGANVFSFASFSTQVSFDATERSSLFGL